ncbi:transposable element Tcb1 transposase [Trichonephila clavipes]|nr:transposable element Tcb1 transposase [Trichonephila clavipes]
MAAVAEWYRYRTVACFVTGKLEKGCVCLGVVFVTRLGIKITKSVTNYPGDASTLECPGFRLLLFVYRKYLDDFLRDKIIGRLECGRTQLEVSEELGIAQSVISRLWQRFQDEATGTTVSRQTVYRRLGHIGLYARRPVRCVPLTATNCRLRLTWSREHSLWTPQKWSCVMFSDEYRTDLHVQSVIIAGHICRDVILEQHVCLFRGAMGAEFLFMDDNARPHRANIVDKCLQSEGITRMDWPAYSPDLNPIEHVWDMLGRRIAAHQPPPTCLPELRRALLDEWCNMPQDQIDNLILSLPRRCKVCIASSGRHTPY